MKTKRFRDRRNEDLKIRNAVFQEPIDFLTYSSVAADDGNAEFNIDPLEVNSNTYTKITHDLPANKFHLHFKFLKTEPKEINCSFEVKKFSLFTSQ